MVSQAWTSFRVDAGGPGVTVGRYRKVTDGLGDRRDPDAGSDQEQAETQL